MAVRVSPGAARNAIEGAHDGALHVRVTARPVDGAANEALRLVLADALGVAKTRVRIVGGETTRRKTIEVEGITAEAVRSRWPGIAV